MRENMLITEVPRFGYENAKPFRLLHNRLARASFYRLICEVRDSQWDAACMIVQIGEKGYIGQGVTGLPAYDIQLRVPAVTEEPVTVEGTLYDGFFRFNDYLYLDTPPDGRISMGYFVPPPDKPEMGVVKASTIVDFSTPNPDSGFDLPPPDAA